MGPRLDAWVAEYVMGWVRHGRIWTTADGGRTICEMCGWEPSCDWRDTGGVLDKMAQKGWNYTLYSSADFEAVFVQSPNQVARAVVLPPTTILVAICRAALLALREA